MSLKSFFNTMIAPLVDFEPIITVVLRQCEGTNCLNEARWEVSSWDEEAAAAGEGALYYSEVCDDHLIVEEGDRVTKLEVA